MTDACFVSWPLRDGGEGVRAAAVSALDGADGTGLEAVLPVDGVSTASVFVRGDDLSDLVWYVEHDGDEQWCDPAAVVREQSPLFPALAGFLAEREPTVVADGERDAVRLVHASLPGRPRGFADQTGELPVVLSADDADGGLPDVVPLRLAVEPGLGTAVARLFAGIVSRLADDGFVERAFDSWTQPVLEAEGMYTETLLLERTDAGYDLWWYMESAGMEQVGEAYYETDNRVARASEHVLGWVLERPERALAHPGEATDFELLVHAVAADRE